MAMLELPSPKWPTPEQEAGVICAHFRGFVNEEGAEIVECQLGLRPTAESFFCLKECKDYCPGMSISKTMKIRTEILDLIGKGGIWTDEEVARLLALKHKEDDNGVRKTGEETT